jgi:putative proteasome-type protease
VGLPLDINIYHNDSLADAEVLRVSEDDPYYQMISSAWGEALKASMAQLPEFTFKTSG